MSHAVEAGVHDGDYPYRAQKVCYENLDIDTEH